MQLLIAKANGYRPSPEGVAILATVGYFPGELTLFSEISRIPLFHALDLELGCLVRIGRFESQPPDDRAMVDRLASIIPHEGPSVLALSGGCDSRFVLGILRKASQRPTLVRLSDDEDAIPMRIAEELGLPITVVREPAPDPDPELYAVMTDAQIYHRGGHYGRLRRALPAGTAYYTGLFADSLVKNAFRAAWKVPRFRRDMTTRLVEHALLARMRPKGPRPAKLRRKAPSPAVPAGTHLRFVRAAAFLEGVGGLVLLRPPGCPMDAGASSRHLLLRRADCATLGSVCPGARDSKRGLGQF